MGLREKLSESHVFGNGFDSSVCEGCPHHETDGAVNTCGACGCPTNNMGPMSLLKAPPESCPRLDQHAEK